MTDELSKRLFEYAEEHTTRPDVVLNNIYRNIWLNAATPHQSSTPYQGTLLRMLVSMIRPKKAVEIGTFHGYSTVNIAMSMTEGAILHTIEANEEYEVIIKNNAMMAGVEERVMVHIGDAKQVLPTLGCDIDFAFVDADKMSYNCYFDLLIEQLSDNGVLVFDNMLWYGNVLKDHADKESEVLKALNDRITSDSRVENILLPIRDGLMICRKLKEN